MRKPPLESSIKSQDCPNIGVVAGGFALGLVLLTVNALMPREGETVGVLAWPFTSQQATSHLVAQSGGAFEDVALSGRIVLAHSYEPGFIRRLYANGAVLVFNPRFLAGCRTLPSSSSKV